jgi:hypothetical protein
MPMSRRASMIWSTAGFLSYETDGTRCRTGLKRNYSDLWRSFSEVRPEVLFSRYSGYECSARRSCLATCVATDATTLVIANPIATPLERLAPSPAIAGLAS